MLFLALKKISNCQNHSSSGSHHLVKLPQQCSLLFDTKSGKNLIFYGKKNSNFLLKLRQLTLAHTLLTKLLGEFIELDTVLLFFFLYNILENKGLTSITQWLRCWIPNPGISCSKPLGGSKVDSAFHPSTIDKMSARNFCQFSVINCLLKMALGLKQLNPSIKRDHKGYVISFCFFFFFNLLFFNPTTVFWAVVKGTGSMI